MVGLFTFLISFYIQITAEEASNASFTNAQGIFLVYYFLVAGATISSLIALYQYFSLGDPENLDENLSWFRYAFYAQLIL